MAPVGELLHAIGEALQYTRLSPILPGNGNDMFVACDAIHFAAIVNGDDIKHVDLHSLRDYLI